ncbi:MAG: DeoR/GlpR transcriptional regulator [Eubacteriaceae bacterium]|uniref:DeoR/GlpR transcriptional regulator n=1 Tax=Candidatus Pseudoramibacter fermentans TaxID=2594427 RepID=A0A6L5GPN1_9FIRM|nr:DeoR/GlpR transcriptional regulator [Candidatus Pseudoramibacter fermentans]RRF92040.1 MAG: DeoR/GlpR transcriptional regulator [Eubacteriaceae bacterium]
MLPVERRKEILNTLLEEGTVKVSQLAEKYGVGVPTIRRDLKALEGQCGVQLMYGGAYIDGSIANENAIELQLAQKQVEHIEEKRIIAEKAAELVHDGDTIALNSGSTVEFMLDFLQDKKNITILTLSVNVAVRATTMPEITVYMPGGKLRNISGAFVGTYTNDFIKLFNIDKAFLGVMAVSLKKGVTHSSLEEIETNKTLASVSEHCYLVADYSKFDKIAMSKMFDLSLFDAFIIDDKIPQKYIDYAQNNHIKII